MGTSNHKHSQHCSLKSKTKKSQDACPQKPRNQRSTNPNPNPRKGGAIKKKLFSLVAPALRGLPRPDLEQPFQHSHVSPLPPGTAWRQGWVGSHSPGLSWENGLWES
eukprot:3481399-Amphidinium_carterae.2